MSRVHVLTLLALSLGSSLRADERLQGIACRSVHLQYEAPEGNAFLNQVTVDESADGTYFCVCGFSMGYFGIQQLADGSKVAIFSVWDPGRQDDPDVVDPERRVRVLHQGNGVRVRRFGNEGTGAQSFYPIDWNVGSTYRFLVTARPEGDRTAFSAYLAADDQDEWYPLATFATPTEGDLIRSPYAFVEDFRRDRISTTHPRRASFGPAWVKDLQGTWHQLRSARFTADSNPVLNVDAGVAGQRVFLATGGDIANVHTRLGERMVISEEFPAPPRLPDTP